MTNTGQSKRSRAYQRQLDDEYQRVWGHRLPQDEKPQPYKKFGLPLARGPAGPVRMWRLVDRSEGDLLAY